MLHGLNKGKETASIFFNLENRNKRKSCTQKLIQTNGDEITVLDTIMSEIHSFYLELYHEKSGTQTDYSNISKRYPFTSEVN